LTIAIMAFLALNLLSLLWSEDPLAGLGYWRKYAYLLLVPAVASSLRPAFVGRAFIALSTGTVVSVFLMPIVILGDIHIRRIHPANPAATMSHLDYSMVLAVVAVLIMVHLAHSAMRPRQRVIWVMTFVVVVGGMLLNIGRSGQIAFVATLVIVTPYLLRHRSLITRAAVTSAAIAAVIAVYAAVPRFQERVDEAVDEVRDAVVEQRIDSNQGKRVAGAIVGLSIIREHPVLGTGIGGNMPEFHRLLDTDFPEFQEAVGWFPHLHNQYLQTGTELGTVGLLSLFAIFAALVAGRAQRPEMRSAAVAVACVYLVGFFGDPFLRKQLTLVLFALVAGIISTDDEAFTERSSKSMVDG
jgi:O-antigen ligase